MTVQAAPLSERDSARDVFFKVAFAMGILVVGLEIGYLVFSPLPYDPVGYVVGRDFMNTWLGGKLALSGDPAPYFGIRAYYQLQVDNFGPNYPLHIWSYPPHLLLFTWPVALLPYMTSYILYCVLGLILYVAVVSEGQRRADHLWLLVLAPAATVNIWTGQNGFLIAALLVGGLTQLDRRPILAGVLFGLLSIKPQLGVLLPLMLALTGRWRTIVAAAATIAMLLAATTVVFGPKVWTAYVNDAMPTQRQVFFEGVHHYMAHMPTVFVNGKIAGLSFAAAMWIQAVVSATTVAAVVWTFWRRRDPVLSNALFITATFTVTPYAFNYDVVLFSWVVIKLMERTDNDAWDYGLMFAVWAIPFLTVPTGIAVLPFSCLPILAFGAKLVWRLWKAEQALTGNAAGSLRSPEQRPAPVSA